MPGPSGKDKKNPRNVRFTEESIANGSERAAPAAAAAHDADEPPRKRSKRERLDRPNEDEMDDVDDFVEEEDDREIPSESETLRAKRERRMKQAAEEDESGTSTTIDQSTSLAADGIEIEPFHMESETRDGSGYFDGDTYVFRKSDAGEEPDAWLDSIEGKEDENAESSAGKPKGGDEDEDEEEEAGGKMDSWTAEELYAQIVPLVSDSETVMQAIVRYGKLIKRHKDGSDATLARQALNDLTGAASALLLKGKIDIYQKTRQDLTQLLPTAPQEPRPTVQWEYKGSGDGQLHGPYTTHQMQGWIQQGYFVGSSAVMLRSVQEDTTAESTQDDLMSDLLDDDDDEENDAKTKKAIKGEWTRSDAVKFSDYT
jgi:CD2 antigen cytoplasmic tail-binding protein 2